MASVMNKYCNFGTSIVCLILLSVMTFSTLASPVDTYEFIDPVTEKRFNSLNKELRCPKCQNQNLNALQT